MRGLRERLSPVDTRAPSAYLSALIVGAVLVPTVDLLLPGVTVLGEVDVAQAMAVTFGIGVLVLWLRCRHCPRPGALEGAFLLVALAAWALATGLAILNSPTPQPSALLMGLLLVLVWAKPPNVQDAHRSADVLGWTLVGVVLVAVLAESLDLVGSWYAQLDAWALRDYERSSYWLPLADMFGLDGRWAGPFIHPNRAGPVGALLLVLGLARTGARRVAFVATGVAVLLLAGSRTSFVAAAAGLATLAAVRWLGRQGRVPAWGKVVVLAVAVLGFLAVWLVPNAGMSGRTTVWPVYVELWRESPWTGVGASGLGVALQEGTVPPWATHAHNLWLDALTRYGVVMLALVLAAFVLALVVTVRAARGGRGLGLAMGAVLIVAGLGHTTIGWIYPEVGLVALVLAVLMSAREPVSAPTSG